MDDLVVYLFRFSDKVCRLNSTYSSHANELRWRWILRVWERTFGARTFLGVNGMTYLQKEKSSFMPIFLGLSIVAVVGFGLLYFMFGKAALSEGALDGAASNPTAPPPAVQTIVRPTHTHV
ncbi:hypothetical protein BH10CYA1_BH10CYA1_35540 [soil metagenome]